MTKYFCDGCGKEVTPENKPKGGTTGDRLATIIERNGFKIGIEVLTAKNATWNDGLFCKHCILDALYQLDDRPKAV